MIRKASIVVTIIVIATSIASLAQTKLDKPTNCTAAPNGTGGITTTCTPVSGATAYVITVRDSTTQAPVLTQSVPYPQLSTQALPIATSADVSVTASNSTATSLASDPLRVALPPMAPTGVQGVPGFNKVTVSWSPSPNATSYQVNLSNGMSYVTSNTSQAFNSLQAGTSYTVTVAAINAVGRGAFSAPVIVNSLSSGK